MKLTRIPPAAQRACAQLGILPSRHFLVVNISRQQASLFERPFARSSAQLYKLAKTMRCSTSKYGIGEKANSNMTPRGLHRIARKVGGGWPTGTAFKSRQVTGFTWGGQPDAGITTRIMWLEGLMPGLNRGGDVDSFARYIYIHGTGNETTLGRPDSHGCVHLSAMDLMPLYDKLAEGTLVWLTEN
jgi:lipoprotein-anchoring transpeptidase ErfK/SrfK